MPRTGHKVAAVIAGYVMAIAMIALLLIAVAWLIALALQGIGWL